MTALYEIETERLLLRQWRRSVCSCANGATATGSGCIARTATRRSWPGSGPARPTLPRRPLPSDECRCTGASWGPYPIRGPYPWIWDVRGGWTLQRSAWGHGYATEGARASLEFGFRELRFPQIFSMTRPDNARSRAVMERCGLTRRGELEFHGWRQVHYAIDREGWPPQGDPLPRSEIRRVG